jgi:2-dehydro-3-deoxyphosphogluconate aldolase / (4S)-4-hydroxy-2-oxoglutarate aldolase
MNREKTKNFLFTEKLAGVIRSLDQEAAKNQISILAKDLKIIEISAINPAFEDLFGWARKTFPQHIIGIATLLDLKQAQKAFELRPDFLVSPISDIKTLEFMRNQDILFVPGACTPTEIAFLINNYPEFPLIKVFPANSLIAFQGLKKIFSESQFVLSSFPVEDIPSFYKSGVAFFAIGSYFTENLNLASERIKNIKSLLSLV